MIVRWLAGGLIRMACRKLPGPDRVLRYQEWTAEAAAILDDRQARWARRQVAAVLFAADHLRGARRLARRARRPATGWRADLARSVLPWGSAVVVVLCTRWLPLARPVHLALFELLQAAGMVLYVIRERRSWLAWSTEEFDSARLNRRLSLSTWWLTLCIPFIDAPGWYKLAGVACALAAIPVIRRLEPRIFTRPGLPPAPVSKACTS